MMFLNLCLTIASVLQASCWHSIFAGTCSSKYGYQAGLPSDKALLHYNLDRPDMCLLHEQAAGQLCLVKCHTACVFRHHLIVRHNLSVIQGSLACW